MDASFKEGKEKLLFCLWDNQQIVFCTTDDGQAPSVRDCILSIQKMTKQAMTSTILQNQAILQSLRKN